MNTTPELTDFRVMFAYLDNLGRDHYEFTTVLAKDEDHAVSQLVDVHNLDYGYQVIQVVKSNGESTGYTTDDRLNAVDQASINQEAIDA